MKYAVFFLLMCVALAAAAPQLLTAWPGAVGGVVPGVATRTVVAGPTVVNGGYVPGVYPGHVLTTGYYGNYFV